MERTLVLLKPDAIQRGLAGRIISRFEDKGLKIVGLKFMSLSDEILNEHYSHIVAKPFYGGVKTFMQSAPVIALCLEGVDCVETVLAMCGITKARAATPGTIRGDWAMSMQANLVHRSDNLEAAKVEVKRFFAADELFDYASALTPAIYSADELQ
ncbi:MAG: nucleoside-diphosphate kinase [Acidobacteria bacterium]|nr:nucleoside-diphosphate kinase [Acidobacteriota bacterium]